MKLKNKILLLISYLLFSISAMGQITSSPYSMFGAGTIEAPGFGTNQAMGGAGIALPSGTFLNNLNPASYSGLDSLTFLYEFGAFLKYTDYTSSGYNQDRIDGNFNYLAIGFRFTPWLATSFGIVPYSSVGYTIDTEGNIGGTTTTYNRNFTGSGGINKFYIANAFRITKNLSVGVNTSFLFGSIKQVETGSDNLSLSDYTLTTNKYIRNLYIDFGLQYAIQRGKNRYSLGLTYGPEVNLVSTYDLTLVYNSTTFPLTYSEDQKYLMPGQYGVGVAFMKGNRFTAALDYTLSQWSTASFANPQIRTQDNSRYSLGLDYTPRTSIIDRGFKKMHYRMGGFYTTSYMIIDQQPINSKGMTFGIGVPLKNNRSMVNISLEAGETGTTSGNLIRERYMKLHFNFTLNDIWFQKQKYY